MFDGLMHHFRKPEGFIGGLIVHIMNFGHSAMTREVVSRLQIRKGDAVLDIGCGGGAALALMAARGAEACGIDISQVAVAKSRQKNIRAVREGRVRVLLADVDDMPFTGSTFDLATAFEAIYFWENLLESFKSVLRVLKPGGRFAIILEAYRTGDKEVNFPEVFKAVQARLYSVEELETLLLQAGFCEVSWSKADKGKWICVLARKAAPA